MTAPHLRQFGRRSDTLLYWSERSGSRQVFQLDLKTGESRQLSEAEQLDGHSIALTADERAVSFFDGPALVETSFGNLAKRTLHTVPEGAVRTGLAQAFDGSLLFAETRDGRSRIVRTQRTGTAATVTTVNGTVDLMMARPRQNQLLFRAGDTISIINLDGSGLRPLKLEPGRTGMVAWTPGGRSVVYLHIPDDPKQLISLREHFPGDGADRAVASTSQFESIAPNGDASVFVGASRSKASAYVLILLRVTRRELTLCEHKASDPKMVSPVFSPDSQSVFFTTDRHGKSALYRLRVDKFVEETGQG